MFRALVVIALTAAACLSFSSPALASPQSLTGLTGFHSTSGVAFSPDGSVAYVVQENNGNLLDNASVIAIDTRTHAQLSARIDAGYRGAGVNHAISMAPNGAKAYVSLSSGVMRPFYPSTMSFGPAITVGTSGIGQIIFTPDGTQAYVAVTNNGGGTLVKVVDVATDAVVASVATCSGPDGLAITPDGLKLYVNCSDGSVAVIETTGNTVLTTFTPAGHLQGTTISMSPDGTKAYVTSFTSPSSVTSVINTANNSVVHQFTDEPKDVIFNGDGSIAYVMSAALGKLLPTNPSSFSIGTPIDITSAIPGAWYLIDKNPASEQYWITGGNNLFVLGDGPLNNASNSGASQGGDSALANTGVNLTQSWILIVLGVGLLLTGSYFVSRLKVNK
jgi:YVTN family beta-propeller protein